MEASLLVGDAFSGEALRMAKPTDSSSKCTGRCAINPDAYQPSPLVANLLICRFCKQVTKKGDPLPGSQTPGQKKPQ